MRVRLELLWIEEYFIESGFELSMYLSNKFGSFGTWLGFESKQRRREGREGNRERREVGPVGVMYLGRERMELCKL